MSSFKIEKNVKTKCGEIFHSEDCNFTIICTECDMKLFDYQNFLEHFQIMHMKELKEPANDLEVESTLYEFGIAEDELKEEDFEESTCLTETYSPKNEKKFGLRSHTREKKAIYVEPDENFFESITLEQPNSPLFDDTNNFEASGEEDILQTNFVEFNELRKKNKKAIKTNIHDLEKAHSCEQCDKSFLSATQLKQHIKIMHLSKKSFKCNQCEESFREDRSLRKHVRVVHEKIKCEFCEKAYKNASSLREHIQTHHETCNFICDFKNCNRAYKSLPKLQRHKRIHISELKHVCEVCGYRTREKNVLVVHLRTHSGEKPFPCPICGKCFISQSMVAEHQASHATERQHKCDVCEATFSRPKALYHHKHLHLGIKKFVCRICDKAYSQAAGLSAHMRQHKVDGKIM